MKIRSSTRIVCILMSSVMLAACVNNMNHDKDELTLAQLSNQVKQLQREVENLKRSMQGARAGNQEKELIPKEVTFSRNALLGKKSSKVAFIEFSDYQCPYCQRFHAQTFEQLKVKFIDTGKVRYVFRDFPLGFHQNAIPAAVAANCAGEQGGYWAMQRELFKNNSRLSESLYTKLAKDMKLNMTKFNRCLKDKKQVAEIHSDLADGEKYGVNGTPGFFIGTIEGDHIVNVRRITGAQPYLKFESELNSALKQVDVASN